MAKFRDWMTAHPVPTHELRGRSRLADNSTTKALIAGRKPISWEVPKLTIENLKLFFGAEGPQSLEFESIGEPLLTPVGSKVYLASNGRGLYGVLHESQLIVLTPVRRIASECQLQIALDGSLQNE